MAENVTCPEIKDILSENECLENFGGLGVNVYVFIKSELAAPLSPEGNTLMTSAIPAWSARWQRCTPSAMTSFLRRFTQAACAIMA